MANAPIDLLSDAPAPSGPMIDFARDALAGPGDHREVTAELEDRVARLTGKEAAIFLPSGTMCNAISFFLHCHPGDEVILHRDAHPNFAENGGHAVHSGVSLRPLDGPRGTFTARQVVDAIWPSGTITRPRTRMVSVEQPQYRNSWGALWSLPQITEVCEAARARGLATHLDGARLVQATAVTGTPVAEYCRGFDSCWISLTKALGAPAGAVLAGTAPFVSDARRACHLFGGTIEHPAILAACGLYALEHNLGHVRHDHRRAVGLASALGATEGLAVDMALVETNFVPIGVSGLGLTSHEFADRALGRGLLVHDPDPATVVAAFHLGVTDSGAQTAAEIIESLAREAA